MVDNRRIAQVFHAHQFIDLLPVNLTTGDLLRYNYHFNTNMELNKFTWLNSQVDFNIQAKLIS